MFHIIQRYGWIPDLPDQRDFAYAAPTALLRALPPRADLTAQCPPVYDQGELGSCTANAIAAAIQFDELKQRLPAAPVPARLFIYYNERAIERTTGTDSGAMLRDGIKTVAKQGACAETLWPYDLAKFRVKPPKKCYAEAAKHTASVYRRLAQSLNQMKGCLASGYPFVFGFTVYESFESPAVAKTGRAPMPAPAEKALGGHAVMAVGYDDKASRFIVRNSWGADWGRKGYFTLPYSYLADSNLAADFWTIRVIN